MNVASLQNCHPERYDLDVILSDPERSEGESKNLQLLLLCAVIHPNFDI
jgi:hypothetical protein